MNEFKKYYGCEILEMHSETKHYIISATLFFGITSSDEFVLKFDSHTSEPLTFRFDSSEYKFFEYFEPDEFELKISDFLLNHIFCLLKENNIPVIAYSL